MKDGDGWITIASRETSGAVDSWSEYLRATRGAWGYVLDVHGHEWLGEPPADWFDEDGEPLPEYRDDDGCLRLPDKIHGRPVLGYQDGGFIGELVPLSDHPTSVQISDCSDTMVRMALESLGWDTAKSVLVGACLETLSQCD